MTLTTVQSALLERARLDGQPLDPEQPNDDAVLLRAETLVLAGHEGTRALAHARDELLVYCVTCERAKRFMSRPEMPGLAWPTCGHKPAHTERKPSFDTFMGSTREGA